MRRTEIYLTNLKTLNLRGNSLSTLPEWLAELKNLTSLNVGGNSLNTLPERLAELKNLTSLNVGNNGLSTLPEWLAELKKVKFLYLDNNRFLQIPDMIYKLPLLLFLSFDNSSSEEKGNIITEIAPQILWLSCLRELRLENNPVEKPPPEVVAKGVEAIKDYFRQLEAEGYDHLYEAKLLIVGEGGAGKTTLAKKIENADYELQEELSTQGIEVVRWHFPMENGQGFRVNIWDFGGQEIYHATHQFFLTKRSLYALVADTRKEDTDFYYWLNIVELLSDNSPLLIVKNEKQDRHREINENQLRGQFSNFKDTLVTNLATNRGLSEILNAIKYYMTQLPHVGTPLPKTWVKVREVLENDSRDYISLEEYLDICERHGFKQPRDKFQLSSYLHDLGVCLHFQEDPLLKRIVILKPKWGTDAVYKVLDDEIVIHSHGRFSRVNLANIWDEAKYANMQDELLRLMMNFQLCYELERDAFIAPQLLSDNQPSYAWDESSNLILRYTYEFLPKGIITRFIVAIHRLISAQQYVWKSGAIFEKDQTKAEVIEYYGRREIKLRIAGRYKKELMTIATYELDRIHASYTRLRFTKLIPCNCEACKDSQEPYFYSFDELRDFYSNGQNEIQCRKKPYKMVNVLGLIDDVMDKNTFVGNRSGHPDTGKPEDRGFYFQAPIEKVVFQQPTRGDAVMHEGGKQNQGHSVIRSSWASGSFYLCAFAVVITALGVLARTVSLYILPLVLLAGLLFVPLIGALQLRQDDRLSEQSFIELMRMVFSQLPLIGKFARQNPSDKT